MLLTLQHLRRLARSLGAGHQFISLFSRYRQAPQVRFLFAAMDFRSSQDVTVANAVYSQSLAPQAPDSIHLPEDVAAAITTRLNAINNRANLVATASARPGWSVTPGAMQAARRVAPASADLFDPAVNWALESVNTTLENNPELAQAVDGFLARYRLDA
jgi:hypothetical protein